jgi:hypothetical protein
MVTVHVGYDNILILFFSFAFALVHAFSSFPFYLASIHDSGDDSFMTVGFLT